MNMQPINGDKLLETKNRMTTLQATIQTNQFSIQVKLDTWSSKQELAKRRRMTVAEFLALYPSQPSTAVESALLAAKKVTLGTSVSQSEKPLEREVFELELLIARKAGEYLSEKTKPTRAMSDQEFLSLNAEPSVFTNENSAIATAKTEITKLGDFVRSGPWPLPGNYDVALLAGTTITYP